MEKLPEPIGQLLSELKVRLRKIYGNKLKRVILYGSYARGDFTEGSDIDVMIILDDVKDALEERKKYFDDVCDLDIMHDAVISVIPLSENDFKTRRLPLILNAKREGVVV